MICSTITALSVALNISASVFGNLVFLESSGRPDAVSSSGAKGLTQLLPIAVQDVRQNVHKLPNVCDIEGEDYFDPQWNLTMGGCYYALLRKHLPRPQALAAYNTGIGNVKRGIIPTITKTYVDRILTGNYYTEELGCNTNQGL